jgi:hypothetical protein
MPRTTGRWIVTALILTLTASTFAEDKTERKMALIGSIVSVADAAVVIRPQEGGDAVTLEVNAATRVMIDGETATLRDLKPGMLAKIPALDRPLRRINARTQRAERADNAPGDG